MGVCKAGPKGWSLQGRKLKSWELKAGSLQGAPPSACRALGT